MHFLLRDPQHGVGDHADRFCDLARSQAERLEEALA
jgi:hypothetical protein